jgi:predicted NBD/HSP70 family sugar kinase
MPTRPSPARARVLHLNGQVLVLREVHAGRVRTRTDLTRRYGISRGSASELTSRLRGAALLEEHPVDPTGRPGRPTSEFSPHPEGPLVCAVDLAHDTWSVGLFELGGHPLGRRDGQRHDRNPATVLATAAAAARELTAPVLPRVAVVAVAVNGPVHGSRVLQASAQGWRDIAVPPYFAWLHRPVLVGNDATFAGLAEARRGRAAGTSVSLHLWLDVGIGGVLVVDGLPQVGATGSAGEFGHLPFGDPERRCPCGATGCWEAEVNGRAMARVLGQPSRVRQISRHHR